MNTRPTFDRRCQFLVVGVGLLATLVLPSVAQAQEDVFMVATRPSPEDYRIEFGGGVWGPSVFGTIQSEQFGIAGTDIDFTGDLGFKKTQFMDGRLVFHPAKKHRLRVQYTPVSYTADSTLSREVVFNGIRYPVNVPIRSTFDWKVWRFGYEYDLIYTDRGFLGILVEARYTEMSASLRSALSDEFTRAKVPLPSFGLVGRVYPLRNLSITAEASGFRLPDFDDNYQATYLDLDIFGTFSFTRNLGVQGGWRRMTTDLKVENDAGDFRFQGVWFGGVVRY